MQPQYMTHRLIVTSPELDEFVSHIEYSHEIALDTEADNMYHYRNRACLLQVRWGNEVALVDALAGIDINPLLHCIEKRRLIMHGSDFDLRLLAEMAGFRAGDIFDTMLAAQLLGHDRIGLGSLVERYFGVSLSKGHQKSDWSQRPLPEKMIGYAIQDVMHLFELRDAMEKRLAELGRLDWMRQRCEAQIAAAAGGFGERSEHAWRIGGARQFSDRGMAVLYELWHWRDAEAQRLDRPPFKVINDNMLLDLVAEAEKARGPIFQSLPPSLRRRYGEVLREVIRNGLSRDLETLPSPPPPPARLDPLSAEELRRQEIIRDRRDRLARELEIDPSLITSRSVIAMLARDPSRMDELLLPWQADLLRIGCEVFSEYNPAGKGDGNGKSR